MNSLALRVAVDKVRRQEPKALRAAGDSILTGSKYMWLTNREPMSEKQREQFSENFPGVDPQRNRQNLWNYVSRTQATKAWQQWLS